MKKWFPQSLRVQLALLVLLATLPAFVLTIHNALTQRRHALAEFRKDARHLAQLAFNDEELLLSGTRRLLVTLSHFPQVRSGDHAACEALFREVLRQDSRYRNIALIDLAGNVVASGLPLSGPVNLGDRSYFLDAVRTGEFTIGEFTVGRISRAPVIIFAYPVRDAADRIVSVIYTGVDVGWLNRRQLVTAGKLPPGAHLARTDGNATVFAHYPDEPEIIGKTIPAPAVAEAIRGRGKISAVETEDPQGVRRIYLIERYKDYRPSGSGNVSVILAIPHDTLYAGANRQLALRLGTLLLVAGVAFLGAWTGAGNLILRPMESLLDTVRRLGEGDLSARAGSAGAEGEMGRLAAGIDRMAEALEEREAQRREAARQLEDAEIRYRKIFQQSPDPIMLLDPDTTLPVEFNPPAPRLLGYTDEEFRRIPFVDLLGNKTEEEARGCMADVMRSDTGECEVVLRDRADGKRFVRISARAVDLSGRMLLQCILHDLTEDHVAEQRLRAVRDHLQALHDASPDMIYLHAVDGSIVDVNDNVLRCTGYTREEVLADGGMRTFPEGQRLEEARARIRQALAGENPEFEWISRRKDGSRFPVEVRLRRLLRTGGGEGREPAVLALVRDITERKGAEERLRTMNQTLETLVQSAPLSICILSPALVVRMWNRTAARVFGWAEAEVLGHVVPIVEDDPREDYMAIRERVMAGETVVGAETRKRRRDGHPLDIRVSASPLRDSGGGIDGIMTVIEDISDRKRAEEQRVALEAQLRQSQKMEAVGRLAGGIAHDFNNLMTVVLGHTDLLRRTAEPDAIRRGIDEIAKAGERAAQLTRQLLAFSRKQVLQPRVIDLNDAIGNMGRMLHRLIGEDIVLETFRGPELGKVLADPVQVEQVLVNLVVNARDAMPTGGHLTIETRNVELDPEYAESHVSVRPGSYVMLSVTDTGCGMDEETKSRLFEPFFTTKEPGKGTGLGLSTVYGIVLQSGGHVRVDSAVGAGTTVSIYLPRKDAAPEPVAATEEREEETPPEGRETLLLVEDSDVVRALVQEILILHGYRVLAAENGEEALQISAAFDGDIDLLVTDVVMPRMGGKALAEQITKDRPGIKVLFMSGYTEKTFARGEVLDESVYFLQKPFRPEDLAWKVREVLGGEQEAQGIP